MRPTVISLLMLAVPLSAQTPGAPHLGWAPGQAPNSLARVAGLAGAALLEGEVQIPPHQQLVLRPGGNVAALVLEDGAAGLMQLDASAGGAVLQGLEGAVRGPDLVVWSPSGDALLLASAGVAQIWKTREGEAPALLKEMPLELDSAAVSDGGDRILALKGRTLYLLETDGSMQVLSREAAGPFTFLAGGARFVWAEPAGLRVGGGAGGPEPLDGEEQEEEDARRLLASVTKGVLLVVKSGTDGSQLRLWNEDGGWVGEWHCPAPITGIQSTGAAGVLNLATDASGPLWMVDLGALRPSLFFVPRTASQNADGGDR